MKLTKKSMSKDPCHMTQIRIYLCIKHENVEICISQGFNNIEKHINLTNNN